MLTTPVSELFHFLKFEEPVRLIDQYFCYSLPRLLLGASSSLSSLLSILLLPETLGDNRVKCIALPSQRSKLAERLTTYKYEFAENDLQCGTEAGD